MKATLEKTAFKSLLRFSTAGSVDDGKSTLIGRLLYDSGSLPLDQMESLKALPKVDGELDYATLTDGLRAERLQGITIDVAYRYFSTASRNFIIADSPGHEQYTRNMATGASNSDLAIIVVDARVGLKEQSRRHLGIAALLGISQIIVAVNKMDLVNYSRERFEAAQRSVLELTERLKKLGSRPDFQFIPVSALKGDGVVERSSAMPWFQGPSILEALESAKSRESLIERPFRFPVQWTLRPDSNFRGYSGQIQSGQIRQGSPVVVLPSGLTSTVKDIVSGDQSRSVAQAPLSTTLVLEDELDIQRGDLIVGVEDQAQVGKNLEAWLIAFDEQQNLKLGDVFLIKQNSQSSLARISHIESRLSVESLEEEAASALSVNQVGRVVIESFGELAFDAYQEIRGTGSFILIDRQSHKTVAAGLVIGPGSESQNKNRWIRISGGRFRDRKNCAVRLQIALGDTPVALFAAPRWPEGVVLDRPDGFIPIVVEPAQGELPLSNAEFFEIELDEASVDQTLEARVDQWIKGIEQFISVNGGNNGEEI